MIYPIKSTELILNQDGSIFHLKLLPEDIADSIILVGDPGRAELVSSFFDRIELKKSNREFVTHTGWYRNKRLTVLSTGIGTDNIDIVLNELDALVNVDLKTKTIREDHHSLKLIRIGTTGGLQKDIPVGAWVLSSFAIGFDALLSFYADKERVTESEIESAFLKHTDWHSGLPRPYIVRSDPGLHEALSTDEIYKGLTISAPGFYGPQERIIRLKTIDPGINDRLSSFQFRNLKITNYEMECSAIYGLSALLGHEAITICALIANRATQEFADDYLGNIRDLVNFTLDRLF